MTPDQVLIIIVIATAAWTLTRILRSPIAEALARRIGGDRASLPAEEGEIAELRTRLSELEERLEFTERMLAQSREPDRLQR
jgi:hypothetical protein